MNTMIPNILIGLGALIVAVGAYLSQFGWNKASEVKQRIEMVRNLAEINRANYQTINRAVHAVPIDDRRADSVEVDLFTAALTSGLFAGNNYERVRLQLRATKAALQAYNIAASFTTQSGAWSSGPRDLSGKVERGLAETTNLAEILAEPPYNRTGLTAKTDRDVVMP
jgi:hypothetical protein